MSATRRSRLDDVPLGPRRRALRRGRARAQALAERFGTPLYVVSEDQLRRNARRFQARVRGCAGPASSCSCPRSRRTPRSPCAASSPRRGPAATSSAPGELEAALRTGDRPAADLAQRADEGRRAARARDPRRRADHARQPRRARAHRRGRGAPRHPRRGSAFASAPTWSGSTSPRRCRPTGLSVREAIQRYKAGIPTEDILAISEDEIRDPDLDLAGHPPARRPPLGRPGDLERGGRLARGAARAACARAGAAGLRASSTSAAASPPRATRSAGSLPQRADAPERSPRVDDYAEAICAASDREARRARDRSRRDPARGRAGAGAVRRRRHPPGDGRQREAPDGADPADLGGDRLLRRLSPGRQPRAQPVDAACRYRGRRAGTPIVADVTGRTCALDVIVPDAELPPVERGDVLAFLDTGAYQDAGATNFNALPRPGTALVTGGRGGADPPPRDARRRLRAGPDPGAPARRRRGASGDGLAGRPASTTSRSPAATSTARSPSTATCSASSSGRAARRPGERVRDHRDRRTPSVRWADLELAARAGAGADRVRRARVARRAGRSPTTRAPPTSRCGSRDADAVHSRLRDAGVAVGGGPTRIDSPGAWKGASAFYASDPDGVTVELIQPAGSTS